ncbi:MAG: B12-binding domain-containing radical SAM protein [Candidatus Pacearchaeota archaeon]|nr:B12-binding domain-containing radical SAM protein [Candidatus Pacearchaeota archaeon]
MKNVLLIEPGTDVIHPPIGLLHLASAIREQYNVKIKDYSGEKINEKEIENLMKESKPLIVGLRVLTGPCIPRAIKISKIAKKLNIPVVWGGPHPTILPEQTLENENIDAVCIGEGEHTIKDILKYFEGKKKIISGGGIKKNNKIKIFPPQKKFIDIDNFPLPSWDILENLEKYFPHKNNNSLSLSTTRGCVFKCGFCHNSNENVKCYLGNYRIANPKRAIEELKYVQSLTQNKINFLDVGEDLHLISMDYTKKFCKAIRTSGINNLKWCTTARYSTMTPELIKLISKHNCKEIMLGIESGSKRIQKLNGKIINLNSAIKITKLLRKNKIFVRNTYIFGHPTETEKELEMTKRYIRMIPSDENLIQLYRPMPATPYFKLCLDEKKIKNVPKKLEEWSSFGVFGKDINVSNVPLKKLFSTFYRINAWEQMKFIINQQKHYFREKMYLKFLKNFIDNRFTHKLKEYIITK